MEKESTLVKKAVAVVIRDGDRVLSLRRPDDDDELPGVWGLPAGSFRENETHEQLIARIGRDKLGVALSPVLKLAEGGQTRSRYRLEMELWQVSMEGTPSRGRGQWASIEGLRPGMEAGSLCCELAVKSAG